MKTAYVLGFGMLGVISRFALNELGAAWVKHPFPTVTLAINVLGSFAIGSVYVLGIEKAAISDALRLGLAVGFLGGFTTFSSFSLETLFLVESRQFGWALLYALASPALGLLAAWAGVNLTRALG